MMSATEKLNCSPLNVHFSRVLRSYHHMAGCSSASGRSGASNNGWVGKTSYFRAKCVIISIYLSSNFRRISREFADSRDNNSTAKGMQIDTYRRRQRCNPLNVLFNIMFLALIQARG